jgi:hypothetical protein
MEGSQDINHQIRHLIDMIHPTLGNTLQRLQDCVKDLGSDCSTVLNENWSSQYMCQGFAFNRKTRLHRDSNGFRNTLEVLYLLGSFKDGHLRLQDLNMDVEWRPRDLCIFDGYTFAHEASDWNGDFRICCISFCRATTFTGLGVSVQMDPPKAASIPSSLRRPVIPLGNP